MRVLKGKALMPKCWMKGRRLLRISCWARNFDSSLEYQDGVLTTETIRPGGTEYSLFRDEYSRGILAITWSDKDRGRQLG